jgi:hypothetical protein
MKLARKNWFLKGSNLNEYHDVFKTIALKTLYRFTLAFNKIRIENLCVLTNRKAFQNFV